MMVEIFRCGDVFPFQELVTCAEWTKHWPKRSTTLFFRVMQSLLAWNCVEKDSFSSRTMDNGPKHAVMLCQVCLKSRKEKKLLTCQAFPSKSSDINLWEYLKRQQVKASVTSQDFHWNVLRKYWYNMDSHFSKTCRINDGQNARCDKGQLWTFFSFTFILYCKRLHNY